jgi:undecaprenyl pyrophosphate phosphatase UppP
MAMAALALIITIPALYGAPGTVLPVAFFAVISICVIGLYVCYAIPIFLRWRMGNKFEQASAWNLGSKWRWMNPISFIWVVIICTAGLLPTSPLGVPWDDQWDASYANYAPLVLLVIIGGAWIGWIRAKSHFTGQVRNIDVPVAEEFAPRPEDAQP